MKITKRQFRRIIKEELGKLSVTSRMRSQGDRKAWASGPELYEDDTMTGAYPPHLDMVDELEELVQKYMQIGLDEAMMDEAWKTAKGDWL